MNDEQDDYRISPDELDLAELRTLEDYALSGPGFAPDGVALQAVESLLAQVSTEIGISSGPTSALLDGSALERRNRRILNRVLAGVTVRYGVTLAQAEAESARPVPVTVTTIPAPVFGRSKATGRRARRAAARVAGRLSGAEAA
ncbi:hypothetical protein FHS29_005033 [Saccharothrix tamanrassetensis]|uniref:Uncharacterized protein n=1 Tax=Saccharothrix tamanrassetensis TaxID=1051531 RepID=A0A841CR08_9PSEU|nr:hypothetical protein [Saccharothrix tamanrassetensis]MBB5958425.1 hypothetical protein [Saccharothrix tamanrassetensis]